MKLRATLVLTGLTLLLLSLRYLWHLGDGLPEQAGCMCGWRGMDTGAVNGRGRWVTVPGRVTT